MAGACFAQNWEVGGGAGYGDYHNGSIISTGGTASAGVKNRFAASGYVSEDMYQHFSGEVRYVYHDGDTFLSSGGVLGTVQAQSHTFTYNMFVHAFPRKSRVRPFFGGGVGGKYYESTGPAPVPQPFPKIAGMTTRSQWKPAFDFGGGVRVRVTDHFTVRGDLYDYITTFPNNLFVPVANATTRGIFHQVTPLFGLGVNF